MQPVLVELVLVLQKVAGDNVTVEIRNILKEVDRNGDGRIDYEEFCDMMRQVKHTLHFRLLPYWHATCGVAA